MSTKSNNVAWRPLAEDEFSVLTFLLEHGGDRAREFLPQLQTLQAHASCTCGCPSISLQVDSSAAPINFEGNILVDDFYGYSGRKLVGMIVFVKDGKLSEMETYDVAAQFEGRYGLPDIDTLTTNATIPMVQQ